MVFSTGIDLVEIERIRQGYGQYRDKFLKRIFTDDEIDTINTRKAGKYATMAGKFSAKEAVMKALGAFFDDGVYLKDIEILNLPSGIPFVKLADRLVDKLKGKKIHISISHTKTYATAVAIISDE